VTKVVAIHGKERKVFVNSLFSFSLICFWQAMRDNVAMVIWYLDNTWQWFVSSSS
jgi:hypothetical protein